MILYSNLYFDIFLDFFFTTKIKSKQLIIELQKVSKNENKKNKILNIEWMAKIFVVLLLKSVGLSTGCFYSSEFRQNSLKYYAPMFRTVQVPIGSSNQSS